MILRHPSVAAVLPIPLLVLLVIGCAAVPAHAELDDEIGAAIERLQKYLYSQQQADGSWGDMANEDHHHGFGGQSAMATLALLYSGQSYQTDRLAKALSVLREHDPGRTYVVAVRAHIWASLPDEYLPTLGNEAEWLLRAHTGSLFDYTEYRQNRIDHSVTQYGVLGLWEFSKRGGTVPGAFWQDAVKHFITAQRPDGGWDYSASGSSYGSMTCAGLTVLYVAQQELYRDRSKPEPELASAIDRGMMWLDKNYQANQNPGKGSWTFYYHYGIERIALANGVRYLNGKDWFKEGAQYILQKENGGQVGSIPQTAFALMFLSRGRVPVWINKVQVPGKAWNNKPNDLYYLTKYLSDYREHELNWSVVDIGLPAEKWLNAPIAYLASDEALGLTDDQKANLKKYIDLGGTLIINPDQGGGSFVREVREMFKEMYPGYKMQPVDVDHPMLNEIEEVRLGVGKRPQTINNGVRDLVVMFTNDWSMDYQSNRLGSNKTHDKPSWKVMINLFATLTNRGTLTNRLVDPFVARNEGGASGQITVARAAYEGNWNPEPMSLEPVRNIVFNQSRLDLQVSATALADAGSSEADLLYLTGIDEVEFTAPQLEAVKNYVNNGGTVLIENIGGNGDFSLAASEQLWDTFKESTPAIPAAHELYTGSGIDGAYKIDRTVYRPRTVQLYRMGTDPSLSAIFVNDRPAVIVSHMDLSLGALGSRDWNITGYSAKSAKKLLTNILLYAHKQAQNRPAPTADAE